MAKAKDQPAGSATSQEAPANSQAQANAPDMGVVRSLDDGDSNGGSHRNISISSINEDDNGDDSSAFESSDTECDDRVIKSAVERIPAVLRPGEQQLQNGMLTVNQGTALAPGAMAASNGGPNIGSVAVQNSSDITFGNKTYIKGPVVIKNIYRDREKNGIANGGYHETDSDLVTNGAMKANPQEPQSWQSSLKAYIKDKPVTTGIVILFVIVVVCVVTIVGFLASAAGKARVRRPVGDGDDSRPTVPRDDGLEDDFLSDPKPLRIVTRTEWLAEPPRGNLTDLALPVHKVIIAHTASEGCKTQAACVFLVNKIQAFHIAPDSKNFDDIAYQFLVGGDGNAYEGRGWLKQGAHTKGFNTDSVCIAFIGTFINSAPEPLQLSAAQQLIEMGLNSSYIAANYSLFGHRQLAPFESPGKALYNIIQTWPHWSRQLFPNHWHE